MLRSTASTKFNSFHEDILTQIRQRLPVIDRNLQQFSDSSILDFFKAIPFYSIQSFQPIDDLLTVVYKYTEPILGKRVAEGLATNLQNYPVVLTANHHGVDYFAQSFQGNLLFRYYLQSIGIENSTVPVFSCGGVPLSNSSFPKGLLVYEATQPDTDEFPFKLPMYSNTLNQTVVLATPRFHRRMVDGALSQLQRSCATGLISGSMGQVIRKVLEIDYLDDSILKLPNYSAQVTALNNRLGKKIYINQENCPEMVYLEFEMITIELLKKDMNNPDSLAYRIFFDGELRKQVIQKLNQKKGCWNLDKLETLSTGNVDLKIGTHLLAGYGSVFFWGIDVLGRHFPLRLIDTEREQPQLVGVDGLGITHEIPFTPKGILAAFETKLIYPNLFTMFMVVSFARGIRCVGGYFQSDYLPAMQQGLILSFQRVPGYQNYSEAITRVVTNQYLSGMMFLLAKSNNGMVVPAGPLEMINHGGITHQFVTEVIQAASLYLAHQIGLFNIYPDVFQRQERCKGWQTKIASEFCCENQKWILV